MCSVNYWGSFIGVFFMPCLGTIMGSVCKEVVPVQTQASIDDCISHPLMPRQYHYKARTLSLLRNAFYTFCKNRALQLHLLPLPLPSLILILALQGLLGRLLGLLPQLARHLLVPALGRALQIADPRHLELELLVLAVLVRDVDDAGRLLDALVQRE